jgi:hypothetical protein
MRAIFISYRRQDSEGEAGRLFDDLVRVFGDDLVFMDVSAIEAGQDFRKAIEKNVASCGVLLSMIGNEWLAAKNEAGERKLDDPADFVRLETASALKRDIPVIPVLVRGARMPRPDELPEDLKDLAYRNAAEITHARWTTDVKILIETVQRAIGPQTDQSGLRTVVSTRSKLDPDAPISQQGTTKRRLPIMFAGAGVLIAAILVYFLVINKPTKSDIAPSATGNAAAQPNNVTRPAEEPIAKPTEKTVIPPATGHVAAQPNNVTRSAEKQVAKPAEKMVIPRSSDTCLTGYVWREASPADHVCVTPAVRAQTANDNAQAASRRTGSGPYGPDTCKEGFVWRDAYPHDHVCVTPATRTQATSDNSAAQSRLQQ